MYSEIYWLTRLDAIHVLIIAIMMASAMSGVAVAIFAQGYSYDSEQETKTKIKARKMWMRIAFPALIFAALVGVFLPTKEDAILIIAGGKAYEYIQSDSSLQKLPYKTTEYMKVLLEREINEIKKQE